MSNTVCANQCEKLGSKQSRFLGSPYKQGYGYCAICEFYFFNSIRCPCCNGLLRHKPKNTLARRTFLMVCCK